MDIDYTALASRVAARAEVHGCVILSRDGLVLGSFPPGGEQDVTPAWLRFSSAGEPDRGFMQFESEVWAYVREGPYAAFAVTGHGTRPGILIDLLEMALLEANELRAWREPVREPSRVDLSRTEQPPWSGRTAFRRRPQPEPQSESPAEPEPVPSANGSGPSADADDPPVEPSEWEDHRLPRTPEEVDRVALAREFSHLLQDGPPKAEEGA